MRCVSDRVVCLWWVHEVVSECLAIKCISVHWALRCCLLPSSPSDGGASARTSSSLDEGKHGGCKDVPPEPDTKDNDDAKDERETIH